VYNAKIKWKVNDMKIIVASFQCESNSKAKLHPTKGDFEYFKGEEIFRKLAVKDIFTKAGIKIIPSIYANALPTAAVTRDIYDYYEQQIVETVKQNPDVDGIYLYVHGSMEVDGIGSGELYMLKEIRKIVKKKCLIALTMDLHANIPSDFGEYADIVCAYKTAPHTDQSESQLRTAKALIYCLENGLRPYTYVCKIPMLVKGDTMLTRYEPLSSLEKETEDIEKDEEVFSANLFFGHCWIDAPNTSASAVVSAVNKDKAEKIAKYFADKLWATRKEYKFQIEAESSQECVNRALLGKENRIFITDSGDNTTAGAEGENPGILKLFIAKNSDKKVCVAGITNFGMVNEFWNKKDGETVYAKDVQAKGKIKSHGEILGWAKEIIGRSLTISFGNTDAVFTEKRSAFIEKGNFDKANVDLLSYRIVAVKLGYLFQELKPYADRELFALSDGASCVELGKLNLKKIVRPMYPLEDFDWKA